MRIPFSTRSHATSISFPLIYLFPHPRGEGEYALFLVRIVVAVDVARGELCGAASATSLQRNSIIGREHNSHPRHHLLQPSEIVLPPASPSARPPARPIAGPPVRPPARQSARPPARRPTSPSARRRYGTKDDIIGRASSPSRRSAARTWTITTAFAAEGRDKKTALSGREREWRTANVALGGRVRERRRWRT